MSKREIDKKDLYESVKAIIECESRHIHLNQQKLYTLFSISFQYLLYKAQKEPGAYIIRVEDGFLAEKLARKAKDDASRKFLPKLIQNRKVRYERSTLFLDYFNFGSWALTSEIPKEKIKSALIVKNTSSKPMSQLTDSEEEVEMNQALAQEEFLKKEFGEHYYVNTLVNSSPETITISLSDIFENLTTLKFDFIPEAEDVISGVKIFE